MDNERNLLDPEVIQKLRKAGLIPADKEHLKHSGLQGIVKSIDLILEKWRGEMDASWEALEKARVLDLAGGSALDMHPWEELRSPDFARICSLNGAFVTVVDIRPQSEIDQMIYDCLKIDLMKAVYDGELAREPGLEGKMFDIIHSSNFVGLNPSSELERSLKMIGVGINDFSQRLTEQCFPLLAERGVVFLDQYNDKSTPIVFQKTRGVISSI